MVSNKFCQRSLTFLLFSSRWNIEYIGYVPTGFSDKPPVIDFEQTKWDGSSSCGHTTGAFLKNLFLEAKWNFAGQHPTHKEIPPLHINFRSTLTKFRSWIDICNGSRDLALFVKIAIFIFFLWICKKKINFYCTTKRAETISNQFHMKTLFWRFGFRFDVTCQVPSEESDEHSRTRCSKALKTISESETSSI